MNKLEVKLLENLSDSLDRVFDRKAGAFDVYALSFATLNAIRDSEFSIELEEYVSKCKLDLIVRSGDTEEIQREKVLVATNGLREKLNDILPFNA